MVSTLILFFARLGKYFGSGQSKGTHAEYDPAADNDLSYEDAILGLEIRSFMQSEYGTIEPPKGVFQRIVKAIEQNLTTQAASTGKQGGYLAAFYRMASGPVSGRLVPSAVAFALLVMVLGTNGANLLGLGGNGLRPQQTAFVAPTPESQDAENVIVNPDGSQTVVHGLNLPIKDETQFYDPVELRLPPKHHDSKTDTETDNPELIQYDRASGAQ